MSFFFIFGRLEIGDWMGMGMGMGIGLGIPSCRVG